MIETISSKLKIIILLLFISLSSFSFSQTPKIKAFPTAEGFGKYATGGRGGAVIKVTNLNDSGPGSLRQALQYTSGPRTIIFEVGGTITLKSVLPVISGDVTIAGQTAPGGGILIKDGHLLIQSSNIIIRHMRFRYGTKPSPWDDSLSITAWGGSIVENIVIDHCSISWAQDENFEIRVVNNGTARNITLQNSIVSEGGYGVLLNGPRVYNISFFENLLANNRERNIRSGYPSDGKFDFEMVNNIVYGFSWGTTPSMGSKFAVINNIYKKSSEVEIRGSAVDAVMAGGIRNDYTDAYISGNSISNEINPYHSRFNPYLKNVPFSSSGINAREANQIEDILSDIGASLPKRDAVDERIIQQYKNGNGSFKKIGEYPNIENGKAPIDTDNDGMPDVWEIANGLDPNDARDRNFVQPDGYTNLEYYLNGMTIRNATITASAGQDIDICEGSETILTATGGSTYLWSTGATTKSIKVSPDKTTTFSVTAYDATGKQSDTDEVTVTVNPLPSVDAGKNITILSGESTTLIASGATSYEWSNGNIGSEIVVSPKTTTTYEVIGTKDECEAKDTVTVTVVKSEKLGVSAGANQSICKRSWATLTATGAASYLWSTGERTASIDVQPLETTDYSVIGYDSHGKELGSDDTTVEVNEIPNVSAGPNAFINKGESTTLTATGASTYVWSNGATTASITVSPNSTRYYSVVGTTAEGCQNSNSVLVGIRNTRYYVDKYNSVVTYTQPMARGISSDTASENNNIDESQTIDVKALDSSKIKTIQYQDSTLDISNRKTLSNDDTKFMEDDLEFEFLVHPNPTNGEIHIKILGLIDQSMLQLYDLSGKSLYNETINTDQKFFSKTMDLSHFESGIYILKLVNNFKVITKKVVLK